MKGRILSFAAACGLAISAVVSAPTALAAPSNWDMVLTQSAPMIIDQVVIDNRVVERTWEAVLRDESGRKVGMVYGSQRTFDATPSAEEEMRYRTLIFEFADGQIVAQGIAAYKLAGKMLKPGKRSIIAITGGTGAYAGFVGEVKTIHAGKGKHRQLLRFVD